VSAAADAFATIRIGAVGKTCVMAVLTDVVEVPVVALLERPT
jgi:hypothetical protein